MKKSIPNKITRKMQSDKHFKIIWEDIVEKIQLNQEHGSITYNGYDSPYPAVIEVCPELKTFSFSKQMMITMLVWSLLIDYTAEYESNLYVYVFHKLENHFEFMIFNSCKGDVIFSYSGTDIIESGIMKNEYDVDGLYRYLVNTGFLRAPDRLIIDCEYN
jgi:hypothetical protein